VRRSLRTVYNVQCFFLLQTLLNKAALSSFHFKAPDSLLFFQCALCVILVQLFKLFGLIKVEPFRWEIVRVWYPVNLIFVSMLATSFWALKDLGVPMSTVLKNMTNLMVVSAEYFMYARVYNKYIWACMGLMVLSALCGAFTDLAFNAAGYFWQIVNSAMTAANMLYLK
jgi:GDP-mannose transporter